jgi:hypothetical protein
MAFTGLGAGTEADPYQITNVDQLQEANSYLTSSYVLMNDIDASETSTWNLSGTTYLGFLPIGTSSPFLGSFDGGGYKITGLYSNRTGSSELASLFGNIRSASSEEKVTNGAFTGNANGWTLGSGWAYNSNNVNITPGVGLGTMTQDCSVVAGETYILIYTTSSYVAGSVTPTCGGTALSTRSSAATFTETFTAVSAGVLTFTPTDTANMVLDTISLIRVLTFKNVELVNADVTGYYAGAFACNIFGKSTTSLYTVLSNIKVSGRVIARLNTGGFFSASSSGISVTDCESNCYVENSSGFIGGFAGEIRGGTFTRCISSGVVSATGTLSEAGGFVGHIITNNTTFVSCRSDCSILSDTSDADSKQGGFIGLDEASSTYTLCGATGGIIYTYTGSATIGGFVGLGNAITCSKCYSKGNIYALNCTGTLWAGGFAGGIFSATDCYSWGDVCSNGIATGTTSVAGGFVAISNSDTFTDSYCTGFVTSDANVHGGFVGQQATGGGSSTYTTCYWDTEASGQSLAAGSGVCGATGLTTAQSVLQASYTGFDFTSTWEPGTSVSPAVAASNLTVWLSETGNYEGFEAGTKDADSFQLTIPSTNEIRWIDALDNLMIGTAGDEWKIGSNKLGTPLSPTNFGVKKQSSHGSAGLQAIQINEVILFVDFVKRKIREMTYDANAERTICPDLTSLAEHITQGQVKWVAYQRNPDSMLWVGLETGDVKIFVYDREQNVLAWANIDLGGDGKAQSGCVIPGETEDVVYLAVNRTLPGEEVYYGDEPVYYGDEPVIYGGGDKVYIEKMAPRLFDTLADAHFVDCGIAFETSGAWLDEPVLYGTEPVYYGTEPVVYSVFDTTAPTSTITGLDHLNGETVQVLGDGVVLDDEVVSDGSITPHLNGIITPVLKAHVGLAFTSTLQPMRIVLGDSMGANTHVGNMVVSFMNTGAAQTGVKLTDLKDVNFSDPRWTNSATIAGLFTGECRVSNGGNFDPLNPIFVSTDKPVPLTVRCMIPDVERTGR